MRNGVKAEKLTIIMVVLSNKRLNNCFYSETIGKNWWRARLNPSTIVPLHILPRIKYTQQGNQSILLDIEHNERRNQVAAGCRREMA